MDSELCYRAVRGRDSRFDGWFVTAVITTGIYCRPSCPAVTPKRPNVRFYPAAAAAQAAGFRACRRCRPDASPGSPEWNERADLAGRAMRLIADGIVDREGVAGLASRLGYGVRQVNRVLVTELGAGPAALARSQRAQTARVLLETTTIAVTDVAFAAGFASIRQFNDTIRAVFATTPTGLRGDARRGSRKVGSGGQGESGRDESGGPGGSGRSVSVEPGRAAGSITLRLPYRRPADLGAALGFLGARAVPGVEELDGGIYRRSLRLPHGPGVAELALADGSVHVTLHLSDLRNLQPAVVRCRRLLDLDADPVAVDAQLGTDATLASLVAASPGMRVPGTVDGGELAIRAMLGQQVSVAAARTLAGRLAARYGERLPTPVGGVTHLFPTAVAFAELDPASLPMPRARGRALVTLAAALAAGDIRVDPGADRDGVEQALLALPGVGAWTAGYIRMRALDDHDVLLPTDLGIRRALVRFDGAAGRPADVSTAAEAWRPWRSYALMHLWSADGPVRQAPPPAHPPAPAGGPPPARAPRTAYRVQPDRHSQPDHHSRRRRNSDDISDHAPADPAHDGRLADRAVAADPR
jgi:AraC family transcriptional regulator, regulatory protein of adaptative response / DNA-3-methyladenine glycosylase II